MSTKKLGLDDFKQKLSRNDMKKVNGSLFGIFCITGVLDGFPGNTQFHFGRCR
jgi:hypothetical protein